MDIGQKSAAKALREAGSGFLDRADTKAALHSFIQVHQRSAAQHIEYGFIGKLQNLKYEYRANTCDRAALANNFREKYRTP